MDEISNADLIELSLLAIDHINFQFQFWLSITFALITACFVARSYLNNLVRIVLGILYLTSTVLIFLRLLSSGVNAVILTNEILDRNIEWSPGATITFAMIQVGIIALGVLASLWFLYSTSKNNGT